MSVPAAGRVQRKLDMSKSKDKEIAVQKEPFFGMSLKTALKLTAAGVALAFGYLFFRHITKKAAPQRSLAGLCCSCCGTPGKPMPGVKCGPTSKLLCPTCRTNPDMIEKATGKVRDKIEIMVGGDTPFDRSITSLKGEINRQFGQIGNLSDNLADAIMRLNRPPQVQVVTVQAPAPVVNNSWQVPKEAPKEKSKITKVENPWKRKMDVS